jgi:PleD family two-component response regulator
VILNQVLEYRVNLIQLSATVLKPSILIVDDDIEALAEMSESLQSHSLTVHTASNVELAVKLAEEQRPAFILGGGQKAPKRRIV